MSLTEAEARGMVQKVLSLSRAETCEVALTKSRNGNLRYARNTVTTAGVRENTTMAIRSSFGLRAYTSTVNEFDGKSLEAAVRHCEALAREAQEDPEFVPPIGPQQYAAVMAWDDAADAITPELRAQAAAASIGPARSRDCVAAGFLMDGSSWSAIANSSGLFAYHRQTGGSLDVTIRTNDDRGSGFANLAFTRLADFDAGATSAMALEKAVASRDARAIEPGKYTVILEPLAAVDLLNNLMFRLDARSADEGRSFMTRKGGGTRLGEQLFDQRVTIVSDPADASVPTRPWAGDSLPRQRTEWIKDGVPKQLFYSRYWAQKKGAAPVPAPPNMIVSGGDKSLEEMIRDTDRAILVTRTWYIRTVDPQTVLLTGLTRDGTFYVENGAIKHAVKNFRFNESPVIMLNNLDALGKPVRVRGSEGGPVCMVPPMRIRDFTFTSLSDAV